MRKQLKTLNHARQWLELAIELNRSAKAALWDLNNGIQYQHFENMKRDKLKEMKRYETLRDYCFHRYRRAVSELDALLCAMS